MQSFKNHLTDTILLLFLAAFAIKYRTNTEAMAISLFFAFYVTFAIVRLGNSAEVINHLNDLLGTPQNNPEMFENITTLEKVVYAVMLLSVGTLLTIWLFSV